MAIVPVQGEHLGLFCTEMPEPVFEDVMQTVLDVGTVWVVDLDPRFIEVCEAGSIIVTSVVCEFAVVLGATVIGDKVEIRSAAPLSGRAKAVVRVTGVRKGSKGKRFPSFTKEEMNANNAFWSSSISGSR